jgi:hypothetical protein
MIYLWLYFKGGLLTSVCWTRTAKEHHISLFLSCVFGKREPLIFAAAAYYYTKILFIIKFEALN